MDTDLINQVAIIVFLVIIGFFWAISIMAIYIFIRYGQNKSLTVTTSLAFAAVFFLGVLAAFISLQKIF